MAPLNKGSDVSYNITINGSAIPDTVSVLSIYVSNSLDVPAKATLTILDGGLDDETFAISSSDIFDPGKKIVITAGYSNINSNIFTGIISGQIINVDQVTGSSLQIVCTGSATVMSGNTEPLLIISYGESLVTARLTQSADLVIAGDVEFRGSSLIEPGKYLELQGLGNRVNGNHLARTVTHNIADSNWATLVTMGAPPKPNMRVEVDGLNNIITIKTPNQNMLVLSDKDKQVLLQDQNGNSIVMNANGITIKSEKNVGIEAGQNVTVKGPQGVNMSATGGDIEISGINTKVTADSQLSAQSGVMTSIAAGMELTLKAAMVMIN